MFPSVILESKENNSKLLKAVMNLTDKENTYIVVYDHSFDNKQVIRERKILKEQLQGKTNIKELNISCFEYMLLKFEKLIEWIYAPEDEFLQKRHKIVIAREKMEEVYHCTSLQKELKKCGLEVR